MNKISRLTALLLALMMIFSALAAAETTYQVGIMTQEQWQQLVQQAADELYVTDTGDSGQTVTPTIPAQPAPGDYAPYTDGTTTELAVSEDAASALRTESGVAVLTHAADGQWQMLVGDVWADLAGETGESLWVTPAMMNGMSAAQFRKDLGEETFTQTAEVSVVEALPAVLALVTRAVEPASDTSDDESSGVYSLQRANTNLEKHLITIAYQFSNATQAATPYYAEVSTTTTSFSAEIKHPTIVGYQPAGAKMVSEDGTETDLTGKYAYDNTKITITDVNLDGNVNIVVTYEPALVNFTVNYWEEKAVYTTDTATGEEVKYDLVKTTTETAYTEAAVSTAYPENAADQYFTTLYTPTGFRALLYDDNVAIAADGSTVVDIYYQRLYYLMVFNLGGGYGVNPVYAKHGTDVGTVDVPIRPGYEFMGWTLDQNQTVYADGYDSTNFTTIPSTVQIGNVTYYAVWKAIDVDYSVTYWLENPNWDGQKEEDHYLYWGSRTLTAKTETVVNASDYEDYSDIESELDEYERRYSTYNAEKTKAGDGVQIAGDGSTVLNVYYDRNEYTLRFYYAMSTTSDEGETTYYVVGGSTWYFGTYNTSNTDDPVKRIDPYMGQGSYKDERGKVDAEPTLNDRGLSRNYDIGSETSTVSDVDYEYHYIQFKAKYGQEISNLWPADVFNSVPYTGTKVNGWEGDQAFASAWNGEYNVYYSHHAPGGNQTIKGNYSELDYQLLWDQDCGNTSHPNKDSALVSYLCFWENAADRGWNVPELYRYNVYVPVFDGDDLDDPTNRVYNGVTYKLREQYDTVDNSTVAEQTAPAINGLTYKAREGIAITDFDTSLYKEAWDVFFYYSRDTYTLTFSNYGNGQEAYSHAFEEDISHYADYVPENPPAYPVDTYVFDGWYTSPELQEEARYTFATMPANDLMLYAKWSSITHNVTVYNTKAQADAAIAGDTTVKHLYTWDTVQHGKPTSSAFTFDNLDQFDPDSSSFQPPTNPGMTFTYWFYYDENGDEKAFSFSSTPITQDVIVYAGWTSDEFAQYTIYYVLQGATTYTDLDSWVAEPTFGSGLAGNVYTENAKGGTDLYENYQTGYFPTVESHSFTLSANADENVYVFEYASATDVQYQVHYVTESDPKNDLGTITIDGTAYYLLAPTKQVTDNNKAVVTENYEPVSGNYIPDAFQKRLILQAGTTMADNVIVFYYEKSVTSTTLEVNHYLVHADGSEIAYESVKQIVNELPQAVTVETISVDHYVYDQDRTRRKDGSGDYVNTTALSFTLPYGAEGVVIDLYYVEETVTINYEAVGPDGATDFGKVDPAWNEKVGVVTGSPQSIATAGEDFRFVGWYAEESCTTRLGSDETYLPVKINGVHVAATYYAKFEYLPGTLEISKDVLNNDQYTDLTGEVYTFTVTLKDTADHLLSGTVAYTIGETEETAQLVDGKLTFTLLDGEKATIADLPHGTKYEVAETDTGKYEYTISFPNGNQTGSIEAAQTITVACQNIYPANPYSTLTVTKTGLEAGESAIIEVKVGTKTFMLSLSSGYASVTIVNLPIGDSYTVNELDAWTWRYKTTSAESGTIQETGSTVTLSNTVKTDKWLHDESSVINDLGDGSSQNINQ